MLPYQSLPNIKRSNFLPPFSLSIIHLLPHVEKTSLKKKMNGRKLRNPKFRRETVRLNNKTKKLRNMKKKNCPSLNCIFFSILISMCSHLLQLCSHGSRLSNKSNSFNFKARTEIRSDHKSPINLGSSRTWLLPSSTQTAIFPPLMRSQKIAMADGTGLDQAAAFFSTTASAR